jgi:hypothetical protein
MKLKGREWLVSNCNRENRKKKNKNKAVCNLGRAGAKLEETGLTIGGGRLGFQLLDFPTFSFSLFL